MAQVTLHGTPINTNGDLPPVGSTAPDFRLVDGELNDLSTTLPDKAKELESLLEQWKNSLLPPLPPNPETESPS